MNVHRNRKVLCSQKQKSSTIPGRCLSQTFGCPVSICVLFLVLVFSHQNFLLWQRSQGYTMEKRKDCFFNKCWENWTATCERMKLDPYLALNIKINLKWIKCKTEHKAETIKLLDENVGSNLPDIGLGDDFWELTPWAQGTKAKINKWDYIKLKALPRKYNEIKHFICYSMKYLE